MKAHEVQDSGDFEEWIIQQVNSRHITSTNDPLEAIDNFEDEIEGIVMKEIQEKTKGLSGREKDAKLRQIRRISQYFDDNIREGRARSSELKDLFSKEIQQIPKERQKEIDIFGEQTPTVQDVITNENKIQRIRREELEEISEEKLIKQEKERINQKRIEIGAQIEEVEQDREQLKELNKKIGQSFRVNDSDPDEVMESKKFHKNQLQEKIDEKLAQTGQIRNINDLEDQIQTAENVEDLRGIKSDINEFKNGETRLELKRELADRTREIAENNSEVKQIFRRGEYDKYFRISAEDQATIDRMKERGEPRSKINEKIKNSDVVRKGRSDRARELYNEVKLPQEEIQGEEPEEFDIEDFDVDFNDISPAVFKRYADQAEIDELEREAERLGREGNLIEQEEEKPLEKLRFDEPKTEVEDGKKTTSYYNIEALDEEDITTTTTGGKEIKRLKDTNEVIQIKDII